MPRGRPPKVIDGVRVAKEHPKGHAKGPTAASLLAAREKREIEMKKKKEELTLVEMAMQAIRNRGGVEFFEQLADRELAAIAGRMFPKDINLHADNSISIGIYLSTNAPLDVPLADAKALPGDSIENRVLTELANSRSGASDVDG